MLRMRHVRLMVLYGLHLVVEQLVLGMRLRVVLLVMVMVVDTRLNSSVRRGSIKSRYC